MSQHDPVAIQYADLTAAFASLGIDLDTNIRAITIRPDGIEIERYAKMPSGKSALDQRGELILHKTIVGFKHV